MIFNIKLIMVVILLSLAASLVWRYDYVMNENKRLTSEISNANGTIEKLDKKASIEKSITLNANSIIKEIRIAPKTQDAPVAPVLDLAIDAIGELQNHRRNTI